MPRHSREKSRAILIDGGYVTFSGTAPYYHYYLKDHLGSNRVVVSPAGTAEQINHYYPFGGLFGESTSGSTQRFKFNGKEFDRTHGVDWYDYGARHMSPDAGRFITIDPMAEKYYNTSPYVYCANNPVNYIDLRGDSLTLTGEQEDIDKTLDIYNKGLGGYYSVKADNNGLVSISPITGKDPSEMRREQQTFYSVISSAVEGEGMAKINIVNNSDEVIIANALNKAIDIGDINAIGDGPYINKYSIIAHETYEAYNFQARNIPLIKAHLNASGIENLMTGSYIDPLQRNIKANGLSSIPIRSKNGNKIIHTINIYTVNGNVKKVSR